MKRIKGFKVTKKDMLSFLKVSNLILITLVVMLYISLAIFKEHDFDYTRGTASLLWVNMMFLIMSLGYYMYFKFNYSQENWLNFEGYKGDDFVDDGAYAEDEVEEMTYSKKGLFNKFIINNDKIDIVGELEHILHLTSADKDDVRDYVEKLLIKLKK